MAETQGKNSNSSEPRYYTWVDAQGIMHNTLITSEKNPQQPLNNDAVKNTVATEKGLELKSDKNPGFNTADFPSEEQHQKDSEKRKADQKPFFHLDGCTRHYSQ